MFCLLMQQKIKSTPQRKLNELLCELQTLQQRERKEKKAKTKQDVSLSCSSSSSSNSNHTTGGSSALQEREKPGRPLTGEQQITETLQTHCIATLTHTHTQVAAQIHSHTYSRVGQGGGHYGEVGVYLFILGARAAARGGGDTRMRI